MDKPDEGTLDTGDMNLSASRVWIPGMSLLLSILMGLDTQVKLWVRCLILLARGRLKPVKLQKIPTTMANISPENCTLKAKQL